MYITIDEQIRARLIQVCNAYPADTDFSELVSAVKSIRRINASLQRINEANANGLPQRVLYNGRYITEYNLTAYDQVRLDREQERLITRLHEICEKYGFYYRVQNDPRGSAIKFSFTDKDSCDWIGTDTDLLV